MKRFVLLFALVPVLGLGAQEVERPVPFDTAGRVMTITPVFVSRFRLEPPAWPVRGDFVDARLFARSGGDFVLVVQRAGGAFERTVLSAEARAELARVIGQSLLTAGGVTTTSERADVISEPAGGAFTRNMTASAALIWGPALAALSNDPAPGTALYLTAVGTTFFVTSNMARKGTITRAQNHMASHGAARGALMGWGLTYALGGDDVSDDAIAGGILAGSFLSTGLGYVRGRTLTDGEAHGSTWGSSFTSVLTAGAIGVAGGWNEDNARAQVAGVVAGGLVGYPLGLRWVRRSRYGITAGDTRAIATSALIGAAAGATLLGDDPGEELVSAALAGGFLAGSFIGARVLARPYDFTESQSIQLSLGAVAGALIGIAIPTIAESEQGRLYAGLGAAGAALGMAVTKNVLAPERVRGSASRGGPGDAAPAARSLSEGRVRLMPQNLALAFRPQRGPRPRPVPLLSLSF